MILGVSLKLYLGVQETAEWAREVAQIAESTEAVRSGRVRVIALPSLPALPAVQAAVAGTAVEIGAQDLHWEDRGAYTGAVSGTDLKHVGCSYVEVGHDERRRVFGESAETVRLKFNAALRNDLTPLLCVGELQQVTPDTAGAECVRQLESALTGVSSAREVIVAYEPVWAIGASEPASADHVRVVTSEISRVLSERSEVRSSSVIYGGSAQRGTLTALGGAVDGLFLGRFVHDPREMAAIVEEAAAIS